MKRFFLPFFFLPLLVPAAYAAGPSLPADHAARMKEGTALFQQSIRPAFEEHCLRCHGGEKTRADFDLTSRELFLVGGESGAVIDLEKPATSFLLGVLSHEEEPTMPPKKPPLPEALQKQIAKWIELGAPYDAPLIEKDAGEKGPMEVTAMDREFWSFQALANPTPPPTDKGWAKTDIDRFVLARLKENQLQPSAPADDRTRIRRAYLDLIGLPPTPGQLEAALAMSHSDLVDELLDSPHYGERWARHWLDAARFGESHGFEQDYDRKYAYHYRDFVIKALNANMPWDQFIRWQLAGDEIAPDDPLAMMATGFLGAGVFPTQLTEKEFESARYDELDDMAATTGTAMLGLTIGCARCHDHKFDPIPVKDYYQFVSTFTTTIRSEIDLDLDPERYRSSLAAWEKTHAALEKAQTAYESRPEVQAAFETWLHTDSKSARNESAWAVLEFSNMTSSGKSTLTPQGDGSVLLSGESPAKETHTFTATTSARGVKFLRIEALTHESMTKKGPGRAGNGNFALSDLKVFATPADDPKAKRKQVKIISAKATHEQNTGSLSVASAFDSNPTGTGWAVDKGGIGKDQAAVFEISGPIGFEGGTRLEFELMYSNNAKHVIGRPRLSISSAAEPPVVVGGGQSGRLTSALAALDAGTLTAEDRETLFPLFAEKDPAWQKRNAAVLASRVKKPTRNLTRVQVTSEGFSPTKHHADGRGFPHFYPETHFLNRGDPNQKQGVAGTGFLQVLMRNGKTTDDWKEDPPENWDRTSYRRRALANWITDAENGAGHLLARVAVNRIWHHHFGRGIVATPNDFGLQGAEPSHPQLLDFLARRFISSGWDGKALHREILRSATWQQSSAPSAEMAAIDPENQWLWRFSPRRLEAEIVRDAMLSASGQLDPTMFGPGTLDEAQKRRSIYFMIKRSRLVPMMQIFDQPEPLASQGSRPSTTIAPQALLFMNNAQVVKWAQSLAAECSSGDTAAAVRTLYLRTLSREPNAIELKENVAFVESQAASYQSDKARQLALADLSQVLFSLNEFIYLP
ncbi:MAG: PSD1 and planctomycete cytochrome C domain-containing protein [Verrucomicrobiales bacterium]|nr:PSD1 and planctomycete cytochrome C domain-containing protein [Verrucomicrobiales bacterium]